MLRCFFCGIVKNSGISTSKITNQRLAKMATFVNVVNSLWSTTWLLPHPENKQSHDYGNRVSEVMSAVMRGCCCCWLWEERKPHQADQVHPSLLMTLAVTLKQNRPFTLWMGTNLLPPTQTPLSGAVYPELVLSLIKLTGFAYLLITVDHARINNLCPIEVVDRGSKTQLCVGKN